MPDLDPWQEAIDRLKADETRDRDQQAWRRAHLAAVKRERELRDISDLMQPGR
jgi:hypothetical protein